jgi:hypothetical protein
MEQNLSNGHVFLAKEGKNAPENMEEVASSEISISKVIDQGRSKLISEVVAVEIAEHGNHKSGPQSKEKSVGNDELLVQRQPNTTANFPESNRHSVTCEVTDQAIQKFLVFSKGQISKSLLRSGFTVPELRSVCEYLGRKANVEIEQEKKLSSLGKEALIQIVLFRLANAQPSAIAPNCNAQYSSKKRKDSGLPEDTTGIRKVISSDEIKQVNHAPKVAQSQPKLKQVTLIMTLDLFFACTV